MNQFHCSAWGPSASPPWVAGLRVNQYESNTQPWQLVLAKWLLGEKHVLDQNPDALQAQEALGMPPSDYWFVGRARKHFGPTLVALWKVPFDDNNAPLGGICPFDTGLLGLNLFVLCSGEQARNVFIRHDRGHLKGWTEAFLDYIQKNYTDLSEYVYGSPPVNTIPEITGVTRKGVDEESRWSWEARVARVETSPMRIPPAAVFIKRNYYEQFLNWLADESCPLADEDSEKAMEFFIQLAHPCDEAAWVKANSVIGNKNV